MMSVLKELKDALQLPETTYKCHADVFEENKSCEELAKMPKHRPRAKHIAVKFHHFRRAAQEQKLQILHVESENNAADQHAKGLGRDKFEDLCRRLMGW